MNSHQAAPVFALKMAARRVFWSIATVVSVSAAFKRPSLPQTPYVSRCALLVVARSFVAVAVKSSLRDKILPIVRRLFVVRDLTSPVHYSSQFSYYSLQFSGLYVLVFMAVGLQRDNSICLQTFKKKCLPGRLASVRLRVSRIFGRLVRVGCLWVSSLWKTSLSQCSPLEERLVCLESPLSLTLTPWTWNMAYDVHVHWELSANPNKDEIYRWVHYVELSTEYNLNLSSPRESPAWDLKSRVSR